jgi:predicted O-methyltransferase YrrM
MPKTLITDELYNYAIRYGVHENPILTELRHKTHTLSNAIMQIPQDQGQLMGILARSIKAQKYLEIGVFTGYSSLCMALHMGKNGQIIALDNSEEYTNIAKEFWQKAQVDTQIRLIIDHALNSLEQLTQSGHNSTFDIAFIDANKSDYLKYYEYCYTLVRPGGLILIDNTLFHGEVTKTNSTANFVTAIQEFNQFIYNDPRVEISLLTIADGLTIAYKK